MEESWPEWALMGLLLLVNVLLLALLAIGGVA